MPVQVVQKYKIAEQDLRLGHATGSPYLIPKVVQCPKSKREKRKKRIAISEPDLSIRSHLRKKNFFNCNDHELISIRSVVDQTN